MNKRIAALRERLFEKIPEICPERAVLFTESMKQSEGQPIVKRRAQALYEVLDKMTIFVRDGELIVGNQASTTRGAPAFPEYSVDWIIKEFNGDPYHFAERPCDKFTYSERTKEQLLATIDYWKGKTLFENVWSQLPEEARVAWEINAIDDTWCAAAGLGNVLPDHQMVLEQGLEGIIERAEKGLADLDLTEPGTISQYWFLQAVVTANKAVINFAGRFANLLLDLAEKEPDPVRKKELLTMSENCRQVPAKPAQSFWQAIQAVWFIQLILQIETNGHAISLGRFDQYLWPYFQRDIERGVLTREKALELVESFFIKANEINKLRSWADSEYFPGYHLAENLAIGGQTADGKDAVNQLTYTILDATADLKLTKPSVSLKWFEGTSDEFMDKALSVVEAHKGGQPALYNDLAVMRILDNMGVKKEDQYGWAPVGCIEATVPGKWDFAAKGSWLNVGKIFEMTLNNGKDPATGITLMKGEGDLTAFSDTHAIMEACKKQLFYYMRLQVIVEHISDEMHILHDQNAFRSSLVHDCIERGKSLIEGGAVYTADGGPAAGHISVGDSLAAIEYAVFEKGILSLSQLQHALSTNFEDQTTSPSGEEIRQLMINKAPKFGNDDDDADKWTVEINEFLGSTYQKAFKSSRYGKGPIPATFALSQSSVTGNVAFGKSVGALPCGRKAGEPVNNGVSPANGSERNGPTAVINSEAKLPSIWFQKGSIFNMRLTPQTLSTAEGRKRTLALVKTHFKNYQYHIQFNVLDDATLEEAQKKPEEYRDLMVRISGYSAFFTPLNKELQNDVIARMKFNMADK
ncbi:glycyl radical protein [Sediminispirochaeta bajacaliforniensis]|uniref:glycyl radical protein n=1 Tax=Sediminispirochaeta bajacaliforniensis TaxID=148 RepID=UPI00035D0EED|nr:formate C-acetyltransferase/glycerol dehydratase family glycyl radical enzyme [Sediminispirochaeta bajacaliforniensis]